MSRWGGIRTCFPKPSCWVSMSRCSRDRVSTGSVVAGVGFSSALLWRGLGLDRHYRGGGWVSIGVARAGGGYAISAFVAGKGFHRRHCGGKGIPSTLLSTRRVPTSIVVAGGGVHECSCGGEGYISALLWRGCGFHRRHYYAEGSPPALLRRGWFLIAVSIIVASTGLL